MPGFVIHTAIAEEYLRKHPKEGIQKDEFLKGVIAPDKTKDKSKTHYGPTSSKVNLANYLAQNKVKTSFEKGYFLHLVTDYLFYNIYFHDLENVYEDYDKLNKQIIEKYQVTVTQDIQKYANYLEGEPKVLKIQIIEKMIEDISNLTIEEQIQKWKEKPNEYKC